ncbi:MAG TPA: type II toxin-antitoxin system HicA family toxin [Blastocatellia bacterium]|jgi:predicted RNA binding protein YcfA (HicA-like mRNA interferase family)|nr:type II toxin-antitoxin system HicA family toxin [Blastocatellia bacterium]
MRLPRDISGSELAAILKQLGYEVTRHTGSHMRLTTEQHGAHHVTIPKHNSIRLGTLRGILNDVADHFELNRDDLLAQLFGTRRS